MDISTPLFKKLVGEIEDTQVEMNSRILWKGSRQFTETTDYVNLGPDRGFPSQSNKNQLDGRASNSSFLTATQNTPYSRPAAPNKPKMPVQKFFAPTTSFLKDESETPFAAGPSKKPLEPDLNASRSTEEGHKAGGKPQQDRELFQPTNSNDKPAKKQRLKPNKPEPQDFKRILIGSVEQVIRWHKTARDAKLSFLFEAVGILDNWSIKGCAQLLLLRGELGQIIQGLFYSVDHGLPPFRSGSIYSIVGKMIGSHKMIVFDAKEIQPEEKAAVQRLAFLCQRQLHSAAGKDA